MAGRSRCGRQLLMDARSAFKRTLLDVTHRFGGPDALRSIGRRWALKLEGRRRTVRRRVNCPYTVLVYHRVTEPDPFTTAAVTPAQFERQMAYVARRFNVLDLSEIVRRAEEGSLPPDALAITFDDGYADNYEAAYPILRRHGLPATIYLI